MNTVLVWLLLVTSYHNDTVQILGRFTDVKQCEHVMKNIPRWNSEGESGIKTRCVQTNMIKDW